jgi:glycosyltransferase involved in cell wall biosynthesis
MSAVPTVSVVIPVYNTERYIVDTVNSILDQTFADFELIILDDGSKDQTPAILRELATKDSRIRLIVRENRGIVRTRNELLENCRGKYMAVNDADDLSMPDRLAKQVEYMEAHPECVLLGTRVVVMDPYGVPVHETEQKLTHDEIERELLGNGGGWALVQSSVMMRVDAARTIGGYRGEEPAMCEDHDIFLRLAEIGRVANLPERLVWYRRHHSSATHTYFQERAQKHKRVKEFILRDAHQRRGLTLPDDWSFAPWKPEPLKAQLRTWGWAAIKANKIAIARKHAAALLRRSPMCLDSWRLMYCALRGR